MYALFLSGLYALLCMRYSYPLVCVKGGTQICFRLGGILANLARNRQKTGHSGHLCFAGRKLMFPVPSDEEGAKAFKKALDTFSMVIQHRNQE